MEAKLQQFNELRQKLQYAKNEKQRYTYTYKPLTETSFPNDITVTPIGTFTPDSTGVNKLSESMMRLNTLQTPYTCVANAALLATKYTTPNNLDAGAFGGTFTDSTKSLPEFTTQVMKRNENKYTVTNSVTTTLAYSYTWENETVKLTNVSSILSANYGYPTNGGNIKDTFIPTLDVTNKVKGMVSNGNLTINQSYNSIFGDPRGGVRKVLKIAYYTTSNSSNVAPVIEMAYSYTWESDPFNLTNISSISSANYGYPTNGSNIKDSFMPALDVTDKVKNMVSNGSLSINKSYNSLFGDPRGGVRKVLKIAYYKNSGGGTNGPSTELVDGLHFRVIQIYDNNNVRVFENKPDLISFDTKGVDTLAPNFDVTTFKLPTDFSELKKNTYVDLGNIKELTLNRGKSGAEKKVSMKQTNGRSLYSIPDVTGEFHYFAVEWTGYFIPDMTGKWTFYINSDDYSFLWIDSDGLTIGDSYTMENATVDNRNLHPMVTRVDNTSSKPPVNLTAGNRYFIRMQFGENGGGYNMIVTAQRPNGSRFTDFKGFFKAPVLVNGSQTTTTSEDKVDISYTFDGGTVVKGGSLKDVYNQAYKTTDPNPVYVSLIKNVENANTDLYTCYINRQEAGSNKNISDVFANGGNISKFNLVNLWQSNVIGDVYNGACILSDNGALYLDSVNNQLPVEGVGSAISTPKFNLRDGVHFMFIKEIVSTSGNKTIYTPEIYIQDVVANKTYKLNISSAEFTQKMPAYAAYQVPTPEWIYEKSSCLAYDIMKVGSNIDAYRKMGVLLRITKDDALVSPNRIFRLVMVDGRLTLQMSINATLPVTMNGYKLNTVYQEVAPNTFPMAKVVVNSNLDQLNLYDKTYSAAFVVPGEYAKNGPSYSEFNAHPYIPPNATNEVSQESKVACQAKCDADEKCRAFYSYKDNGQDGCKIQKIGDPNDPAVLNPAQPNTRITDSKLYIKNKVIKDQFNMTETDIPYNVYNGSGSMKNAKKAYYPDNETKNGGVYFDAVKSAIVQRKKDLSLFSEDPNNYIPTVNISENLDMSAYKEATLKESAGYADLAYLKDYVAPEGFTDLNIDSSKGSTIKEFEAQCRAGTNTTNSFGICQGLEKLRTANRNLDTIQTNDMKMVNNMRKIQSDVNGIDQKFIEMSNLYKDDAKTKSNPYVPDFNGYDDTPDYTTEGALRADINETLLNENTLYILGTITTATVLILAIAMARA